MTTKTKYRDFDLNFRSHPISGDLVMKNDLEAVKQSIKSLIKTPFYDRKFHPEIGCQAKGLLFSFVSDVTIETLRTVVLEVLINHEPRIKVLDILVSIDDNEAQYQLDIIFTLVNTTESQKVTTFLKRVR